MLTLKRSAVFSSAPSRTATRRGARREGPQSTRPRASSQYEALRGVEVQSVEDGSQREVLSLWPGDSGKTCLLAFLTHWADLGSWEYAQSLHNALSEITTSGVEVRCVGLGGVMAGREFSKFTKLPVEVLYADPSGTCCDALGFEKGFGPELQISPYLKLFPMLLGISSKGTIPEVLRGYVGDRDRQAIFKEASLFDILGKNYQRPFELATLRLDNMIQILSNWSTLCPSDTSLLTQQGGTLLFEGTDVVYEHRDSGILMTPKIDDLLRKIQTSSVRG